MKERIFQILEQLVAIKSVSCTTTEQEVARWFDGFFKAMPYFQKHPEDAGLYEIPGDPYGRLLPYAVLRGKKKDAVVLSGHFDVVSTEEYGAAEEYAYQIGNSTLEEMLQDMPLNEQQREDLASGEWIWGRGVADMKGGLAIHATLFEMYAKQAETGELEGSLVFIPVCDEESYSAGMRSALTILRQFKEKYALDYKLLIDPEPTVEVDGRQTLSLGSVGKLLPAVLVQTKKAHAGHCYEGFSALNVLADIYLRTNGSLAFSDVYKDEATVPPTWANLRDMKPGYDVSIPHRAYGYFSVLCFDSTPDMIEEKLREICTDAFVAQAKKLNAEYQLYKKMHKAERTEKIEYEPCVVTFRELCEIAKEKDPEGFDAFYQKTYEEIAATIGDGSSNYPAATITFMEKVLDFTDIQYPITVIGFAPPYYPPIHSDRISGKEGFGTKVYEHVKEVSEREYGREIVTENYFMGFSDLSYSGITAPFDYEGFALDTPLFGKSYSIDFDTMEDLAIPGIIYGPIGREYHMYVERVLKKSLLEEVPGTTKDLIEYVWSM
jgi:arginine utilization protein RocB